jgi:hypothetical protein
LEKKAPSQAWKEKEKVDGPEKTPFFSFFFLFFFFSLTLLILNSLRNNI